MAEGDVSGLRCANVCGVCHCGQGHAVVDKATRRPRQSLPPRTGPCERPQGVSLRTILPGRGVGAGDKMRSRDGRGSRCHRRQGRVEGSGICCHGRGRGVEGRAGAAVIDEATRRPSRTQSAGRSESMRSGDLAAERSKAVDADQHPGRGKTNFASPRDGYGDVHRLTTEARLASWRRCEPPPASRPVTETRPTTPTDLAY